MAVIDLRKFRRLVIVVIIVAFFGILLNNMDWVLKVIYPIHYREIINQYAEEYNIDPYLVAAIIRTESKFYEKAKSSKDARGLMQVSPITGNWAAKELMIENYDQEMLYIPDTNVKIGCWYLHKLNGEFDGNLQLILAAYNGGSGNVNKWLNNPKYSDDGNYLKEIPFNETKEYVKKVIRTHKIYKTIYETS